MKELTKSEIDQVRYFHWLQGVEKQKLARYYLVSESVIEEALNSQENELF